MTAKLSPVDFVRQYNPELADSFGALRKAAVQGPLDEATYELVVIGSLATVGEADSFKVHLRRLHKLGIEPAAMRQAVTATLAATSNFSQVVAALRWIDEVLEQDG